MLIAYLIVAPGFVLGAQETGLSAQKLSPLSSNARTCCRLVRANGVFDELMESDALLFEVPECLLQKYSSNSRAVDYGCWNANVEESSGNRIVVVGIPTSHDPETDH